MRHSRTSNEVNLAVLFLIGFNLAGSNRKATPPPLPRRGALKISKPWSCISANIAESLVFNHDSVIQHISTELSFKSSRTPHVLLHKERVLKQASLRFGPSITLSFLR